MLRPTAISVSPLPDFKLLLTFDNGEVREFDVKPYFEFKSFAEVKNRHFFKTVKVNGFSVEWIGINSEIDICPDELYYDSVPIDNITKK